MKNLLIKYRKPLILIGFVIFQLIILLYIIKSLNYFSTDADRSKILNESEEIEQIYIPVEKWNNQTNADSLLIKDLLKDYNAFWYKKFLAEKNNDTLLIKELLVKKIQPYFNFGISQNINSESRIEEMVFRHQPTLHYFSKDGKFAVIKDDSVQSVQFNYQNNQLISKNFILASYSSYWVLEDGYWKLRQLEQLTKENNTSDFFLPKENNNVIQNFLRVNGENFTIKGTNYYPQKQAWDNIWNHFNSEIIEKDLQLMHQSGLNCIRVFIPFSQMGKAFINPDYLKNFQKFLDLCAQNKIFVIPTLFDFYYDYASDYYAMAYTYMYQIVQSAKNHPALLGWDIKNEPDLDFKNYGSENVLNWLQFLTIQLKKLDPKHFITIGWSTADHANLLQENVDLISFHYYLPPKKLSPTLQKLQKKISNKPIAITEFGCSSYEAFWFPGSHNKAQQADYYREMFLQLKKNKISHFMHWTLYDYDSIPDAVVGKLPWRKNLQKHFGFIDHKGFKKPAFSYINGALNEKSDYFFYQLINSYSIFITILSMLTLTLIITVYKYRKKIISSKIISKIVQNLSL